MMNNEWINWEGGECPVDGDTLVDVVLADDYYNEDTEILNSSANTFDWHGHPEQEVYLIKYRLSKEQA